MNELELSNSGELKPGVYRHYKGNEYDVLYVATHTETGEKMVVYKARYGTGEVWVRPLAMFTETVTIDDVTSPRFTYLGEA